MLIRQLVDQFANVLMAQADDFVSSILSKTKGSHKPIFVYKDDEFIGLISLYQVLYRSVPTAKTRVSAVMTKPPRIAPDISIYDCIAQMLSLRLYTLPVFEEHRIIGVIRAGKIISLLLASERKEEYLKKINIDKPFLIQKNTQVRHLYADLRKKNLSRAIIVDENNKLRGIITRRDIYQTLISPSKSGKMRTSHGKIKNQLFDKEWPQRLSTTVRDLMTTRVVTSRIEEGKEKAIKRILDKGTGSIVLVDKYNIPKGMISMKSLLKAARLLENDEDISLVVTDKNKLLSHFRLEEVKKLLASYSKKVAKVNLNLSRVELIVEGQMSASGKVTQYHTALKSVFGNKSVVLKTQDFNLRKSIQMAASKSYKRLGMK